MLRYSIAFPLLCNHFSHCVHPMCPEEVSPAACGDVGTVSGCCCGGARHLWWLVAGGGGWGRALGQPVARCGCDLNLCAVWLQEVPRWGHVMTVLWVFLCSIPSSRPRRWGCATNSWRRWPGRPASASWMPVLSSTTSVSG